MYIFMHTSTRKRMPAQASETHSTNLEEPQSLCRHVPAFIQAEDMAFIRYQKRLSSGSIHCLTQSPQVASSKEYGIIQCHFAKQDLHASARHIHGRLYKMARALIA